MTIVIYMLCIVYLLYYVNINQEKNIQKFKFNKFMSLFLNCLYKTDICHKDLTTYYMMTLNFTN